MTLWFLSVNHIFCDDGGQIEKEGEPQRKAEAAPVFCADHPSNSILGFPPNCIGRWAANRGAHGRWRLPPSLASLSGKKDWYIL